MLCYCHSNGYRCFKNIYRLRYSLPIKKTTFSTADNYELWWRDTGIEEPDDWTKQYTKQCSIAQVMKHAGVNVITHLKLERGLPPNLHELTPKLTHLSVRFTQLDENALIRQVPMLYKINPTQNIY